MPSRWRFAVCFVVAGGAACNGVWGLDEVVVGEPAGASTAVSTVEASSSSDGAGGDATTSTVEASSGSGGAGGDATTSTSTGAGGGDPDCACGCASLFPLGALETVEEVDLVTFDAACPHHRDDAGGGCHALTLDGASQFCTHIVDLAAPIETNGSCAVGRVRGKTTAGGSDVFVGLENAAGEMIFDIATLHPGPTYQTFPINCRIADGLDVRKVYFGTNKKDPEAKLSLDFVELDIAPCDGDLEELCEQG